MSSPSTFSRRSLLATGAGAVAATGLATPANAATEVPFKARKVNRPKRKPNLLVILGDDHPALALGGPRGQGGER